MRRNLPIHCNELAPREIATGVVLGRDDSLAPLPRDVAGGAVRALELSLIQALSRPPCLVSFSGGRDSSAVLAVASRTARREGLPEPIPVTARYPGFSETEEESWQLRLVRHLGLADWVRRIITDDADLVGPLARQLLEKYGLQYPYNLHLQVPLMGEARAGSFVTGLGGDEAFSPGPRALAVLTGRAAPRPRDLLQVGLALAPRRVRRAVLGRRPVLSFPWLDAAAKRAFALARLDDMLRLPLRWDAGLREWWRSRYVHMTMRGIARVAEENDVRVSHPFADALFVSALSREGGVRGFPSRTAAMRALFGDVLPDVVARRGTKASFDSVLWSRHTRSFVGELSAADLALALRVLGLESIVDRTALAAHWAGPSPMANSFLLLQACWLALRA